MKIMVIFTGGTIGSSVREGMIGPKEENQIRLLSLYREKSVRNVAFETVAPFTILSENSTGNTLCRLAECVRQQLQYAVEKAWDGIIITHGTDTLAYTAAMLGYLFADTPVPIVLVSSNYVLEEERANGLSNFYHAVEFIAAQGEKGVFVSYENGDHIPRIHRGTRVIAHQAYSDEVFSVLGQEYGHFEAERFVKTEGKRWERKRLVLQPPKSLYAPIMQIIPYPGMQYPVISEGVEAVLHHTYHAGTICSDTAETQAFFQEAWNRQIPVFLTGAMPGDVYESTRRYQQYHIHILPPSSPISMYMKLWLLLVNGLAPEDWMAEDIGGEFLYSEGGNK